MPARASDCFELSVRPAGRDEARLEAGGGRRSLACAPERPQHEDEEEDIGEAEEERPQREDEEEEIWGGRGGGGGYYAVAGSTCAPRPRSTRLKSQPHARRSCNAGRARRVVTPVY